MKKIISILIVSLLMLQCVAFADYKLGTESDVLVLSGNAEPYQTVSFMLLNSDTLECEDAETTVSAYYTALEGEEAVTTDIIFYHNTTEASSDGIWEFTVPMTGIEKVDLTLISNTEETEYIQYGSVSFRTNMIPALKEKAAVDDEYASLAETMAYYIDFITDSPAIYKSLKDKKAVAEFCADTIKGLTENSESLTLLKDIVNKAIKIAAISEGKITDFNEVMYFDYDKDILETITGEGMDKAVELVQGKKYVTEEDYIAEANLQLVLQHFNFNVNKSGDNLLDVLKDSNDVLGLDLSELLDLSKSKQTKAVKKLADKKSKTVKAAQDNLDDIVDDLVSSSSGSSGGGGGGNGSVIGSGSYIGSTTPAISDEYIQEQKYVYSDMAQTPWAADAVLYLSEKEIVSGYTDGTFRPMNNITRAEFTKLVTEAFYGISAGAAVETTFTDVNESAWYAPYIAKAQSEGLIAGRDNGTFAPDDTITRQDMAVILYNAAAKHGLISAAEDYYIFDDDLDIASYAKTAVYTLRKAGIISGVGENLFAPESNANRASAAQMIYGLMTKLSN